MSCEFCTDYYICFTEMIFFISFIEQGSNYRELHLRTGQQSKNAKPCNFVPVVINGKLPIGD